MSIRIDMTSPDVDKQLHLLEYYPEILEKHFRPALKETTGDLRDEISPNIPVRSGRALAAFKARVTGKGLKLQGQVGWWGKTAAWYINIVEHGAKPHRILPKEEGGKLRLLGGRFVSSVDHPGFSPRGFMKAGYAALQGISDQRMTAASEAVLRELRVP